MALVIGVKDAFKRLCRQQNPLHSFPEAKHVEVRVIPVHFLLIEKALRRELPSVVLLILFLDGQPRVPCQPDHPPNVDDFHSEPFLLLLHVHHQVGALDVAMDHMVFLEVAQPRKQLPDRHEDFLEISFVLNFQLSAKSLERKGVLFGYHEVLQVVLPALAVVLLLEVVGTDVPVAEFVFHLVQVTHLHLDELLAVVVLPPSNLFYPHKVNGLVHQFSAVCHLNMRLHIHFPDLASHGLVVCVIVGSFDGRRIVDDSDVVGTLGWQLLSLPDVVGKGGRVNLYSKDG